MVEYLQMQEQINNPVNSEPSPSSEVRHADASPKKTKHRSKVPKHTSRRTSSIAENLLKNLVPLRIGESSAYDAM